MNSIRVLLADDHEVVRKGVRALLESHPGYEVIGEAVDGRDAIEKAARLRPDVVILDVGMPDINGLEATRQIVNENPQTRVLILTIHDAQYMASEALRAGARGYVLKSDAGPELLLALESLRQNKPFFTPKVAELVLEGFKKAQEAVDAEAEFPRLTSRETEIVQLLAEGKTSKEVANLLSISLKTVETHRSHIMSKLGVHSVAELVRYAIRERIVDP
jgi:DNA-binding NarL/FixJ family response regulator